MPLPFLSRIVEERILEAQRAGAFDNLPGTGKPLALEDLSWVPEDLRATYIMLKNANLLPPEAELIKEIRTLEDLLKYVDEGGERRALVKTIHYKIIRLDLLRRRSIPLGTVRRYGRKLVRKFCPK
jgi:hypothetical protein